MSPEQAQIEDAIEQASNPAEGETARAGRPPSDDAEWQTWSGRSIQP